MENSNKINTKKLFLLRRNLALAGFFFLCVSGCDLYSNRIFSKTLLQVEDRKMTVQEFSKKLALKLRYLDPLSAKDTNIINKFKDELTSDFIVDQLIELWFDENKLSVNEEVLKKRVEVLVSGYPNDSEFRKALSEEELSYKEWEDGVRRGLKREALFDFLRKKIDPISDGEIKSYYDTNKNHYYQKETVLVKSILLKDENQVDVIKKLAKKTPFEKLVTEYSIEIPKPKDGIYAWIERDSVAELEVLFTNKKNDLIGPIRLDEGWRLFKVVSRKPSRQKSLDEVNSQIQKEILSLREKARFSAWLDEQIKRYKILKNSAAVTALKVETRKE